MLEFQAEGIVYVKAGGQEMALSLLVLGVWGVVLY